MAQWAALSLNASDDMQSKRSAAIALARRGFRVFRCQPNRRKPIKGEHFKELATSDVATVFEMWDGEHANCNVGVSTAGLVVLDVDNKHGKTGDADWQQLGDMPATLTVRTPSGGWHYYFTHPEKFGLHDLTPSINVRAEGGLVVGPGSTIDGTAYSIALDVPIAPLPAHIAERLRKAADKQAGAGSVAGELDTAVAIECARDYLDTAPEAIDGSGGDTTTIYVANRVLDFGLSVEMACEVMEDWNARCSPPWDSEDLERKVQNAANSRSAAIGRDNPLHGFEDAVPAPAFERSASNAPVPLEFPSDLRLTELATRQAQALVKGVLYPGDTGIIYGESTAGKTFCALDLAWHVAQGKPWHGNRTRQAQVLYVCLEGVDGFRKRMIAASMKHSDPGKWLARLGVHVSLRRTEDGPSNGREGVETIINGCTQLAAQTGARHGLVIIDTLARAIAGDDENAVADTMAFIEQRAGEIARRTGYAVVIVHHSNKSGDIRGSGALKQACDMVLRAERAPKDAPNQKLRTLRAEKVKDGDERKLFDYELEVLPLGFDDDGDPITSCVVRPVKESIWVVAEARDMAQRLLTDLQRGALSARDAAAVLKTDNFYGDVTAEALAEKLANTFRNSGDVEVAGQTVRWVPEGRRSGTLQLVVQMTAH